MHPSIALISALCLASASPAAALAQDLTITIKNHRFEPAQSRIPARKRINVTVVNSDATPEEFESRKMKVEKVIPGNTKAVIRIGPLEPGRYEFVGEFHEKTAKGEIIVE